MDQVTRRILSSFSSLMAMFRSYFVCYGIRQASTSTRRPDFETEIAALDEDWQGRTIAVMLRHTKGR
jgi:hypothetical protein